MIPCYVSRTLQSSRFGLCTVDYVFEVDFDKIRSSGESYSCIDATIIVKYPKPWFVWWPPRLLTSSGSFLVGFMFAESNPHVAASESLPTRRGVSAILKKFPCLRIVA